MMNREWIPEGSRGKDLDASEQPPAVLMLGGFGRSGSTLLERCLAECPGVVGLGEVLHLWERGLRDDELCGCSLPFSDCPFWTGVGEYAYGGWESLDSSLAVEDRTAVVRNRYLPELVTGLTFPTRRRQRQRLLDRLDALYRAARKVGAAQLIVDSSKHPAYAYLLRRASVQLKCVLVVRDPRGVAYSWAKVVKRPEAGSSDAYMPRYSTAAAVANWAAYGLLFHALTLLRVPVKTVHYEDFMAHPRRVVDEILSFAGVDATDTSHIQDDAVTLSKHHTVAGNPMRFRTGRLEIRKDSVWQEQMPLRDRRLAGLISLPLRFAYRLQQSHQRPQEKSKRI
ncbi:sulfotransferase [Arthrobacter flavus]|uniref:Sulfotransferase n=1 Tax=Arthrobacter flavus TaxID=95172 RepID=A0ABW4Q8Y3_9MICC